MLNENGQSMIEFIIMLPVLLGVTLFLIKVNTAIQMSIVNQQYSRAQTLYLASNHSEYPALRFREGNEAGNTMLELGIDQMILGISDNIAESSEQLGEYEPEASVQSLVRPGKPIGNDDPGSEPESRGRVRIRNTVALCTQTNSYEVNGNVVPARQIAPGATLSLCRSPYRE